MTSLRSGFLYLPSWLLRLASEAQKFTTIRCKSSIQTLGWEFIDITLNIQTPPEKMSFGPQAHLLRMPLGVPFTPPNPRYLEDFGSLGISSIMFPRCRITVTPWKFNEFAPESKQNPKKKVIFQPSCVPGSKLLVLGTVIPPLIGSPYNGYINPYYKVDDHPYHRKTMGV